MRIRVSPIYAASSRKNTRDIIKVKSSNMWGYTADIRDYNSKFCTLYIQFKDTYGGPGDVYAYYDVPVSVYRRMHTAPSKGHFFWNYIRNNYKYAKLTGDKRAKLANGIN